MDIKIVDPATGQEKIPDTTKPLESLNNVTSPVMPELQTKAVEQVMGLETDTDKYNYKDKVNTILEWAKSQTKDHSPQNLKWVIRSLELKLGTPPLAEKRINYLARWAYLDQEEKKLLKEKKQFEQNV